MNLTDWAEQAGVSKFTAYRWFREGILPVPARRVGRLIMVDAPRRGREGRTVIYARVALHDYREDLARQVTRLQEWAAQKGHEVDEVVTEVGAGMGGKRRKLSRLLADPTAATIIVEHRDRLARFGVEYLQSALSAQGRRILVVDGGGVNENDLIRDMTDALTAFCAQRYGKEGARNRAEKAMRCLRNNVGPGTLPEVHDAGGDSRV